MVFLLFGADSASSSNRRALLEDAGRFLGAAHTVRKASVGESRAARTEG